MDASAYTLNPEKWEGRPSISLAQFRRQFNLEVLLCEHCLGCARVAFGINGHRHVLVVNLRFPSLGFRVWNRVGHKFGVEGLECGIELDTESSVDARRRLGVSR